MALSSDDPLAEAIRILDTAAARDIVVRLMGGLAFHMRVSGWLAPVERFRRDIDLVTLQDDVNALANLLEAEGYQADRAQNALFGHRQMYFVDRVRGRPVDVVVDKLDMCHKLDLRGRLTIDERTIPLADLLLSKLQVVEINRKDLVDALILVQEFPLGDSDDGAISVPRIVSVTSTDWGWWRTVTRNVERLRTFVRDEVEPAEIDVGRAPAFDPLEQIRELRSRIDAATKSAAWKLRAVLGERKRWYQLPDVVSHDLVGPR